MAQVHKINNSRGFTNTFFRRAVTIKLNYKVLSIDIEIITTKSYIIRAEGTATYQRKIAAKSY